MGKRKKAGLPDGFELGIDPPNNSKPIRTGDYIDDVLGVSPHANRSPIESVSKTDVVAKTVKPEQRSSPATGQSLKRARLNVSMDGRKRLSSIVDHMANYGPEPDIRASEVIEALILALYDAQDQLDLSNVRRRGKFGSQSHKNFPIALAESIAIAMAETHTSKTI